MPAAKPIVPLTEEQRAEVERHTGIAYLVAAKSRVRLDPDERLSVALEAICRAVPMFDPSRGFKISTFLSRTIKHELSRAEQAQRLIRVPCYLYGPEAGDEQRQKQKAAALSVRSISGVSGCGDGKDWNPAAPDGREVCEHEGRLDALRSAVAALPDYLRDVIRLRHAEGLTLRQAGRATGLSYESIRRMEREAHRLIREHMAAGGVS